MQVGFIANLKHERMHKILDQVSGCFTVHHATVQLR